MPGVQIFPAREAGGRNLAHSASCGSEIGRATKPRRGDICVAFRTPDFAAGAYKKTTTTTLQRRDERRVPPVYRRYTSVTPRDDGLYLPAP